MAVPATLEDLRSDADELAGLGLSADERDRLINEGHVELCARSGWTRARLELGPSVAEQELYALPASFRRFAEPVVTVGSEDYAPGDAEAVRAVKRGTLYLAGDGVWWLDHTAGGARSLGIYPVPSAGTSISALCVVTPALLDDDADVIACPADYAAAIRLYVRAHALGEAEDDAEARERALGEFDRQVARLMGLVNEVESGSGPIQAQVAGWHY